MARSVSSRKLIFLKIKISLIASLVRYRLALPGHGIHSPIMSKALSKIFTGKVKATKAVASPIGIAVMFGSHIDWVHFWSLVGFLSMVLAFTNLLPIPALDGGHAVFLIIEMIKGKPLSDKFLEKAQIVGFVILIGLMVFAFGNDIIKHIVK